MADYSKYSGLLRGGSPWAKGPLAPKYQHGWLPEDKSTLPKDKSSTLQFSKVGDKHVGGTNHETFKSQMVARWQYKRMERADVIEKQVDKDEGTVRNKFFQTFFDLTADATEIATQKTKEFPGTVSTWVVDTIDAMTAQEQAQDVVIKKSTRIPESCRTLAIECKGSSAAGIRAEFAAEQAVARARQEMALAQRAKAKTENLSKSRIFRHAPGIGKEAQVKAISILQVSIIAARNLPKMDAFLGKVDPFATLTLLDPYLPDKAPERRQKTKVIWADYDPQWNEVFEYTLPSRADPRPRSEMLLLQVYDYDMPVPGSSESDTEEYVGQVLIPLSSFVSANETSKSEATAANDHEENIEIFADDGTDGGRKQFVHHGSIDRWYDFRTADNSEVVHGHKYGGSPASIHLIITFKDSSLKSDSSDMAVNLPDRKRNFKIEPAPHPDWWAHPANTMGDLNPWALHT